MWAGKENCEPVTWKECRLAPQEVDFEVPHITCEDGEDFIYDDYVDVPKKQMTNRMECIVKHTTSCQPKISNKCQTIEYQVIVVHTNFQKCRILLYCTIRSVVNSSDEYLLFTIPGM